MSVSARRITALSLLMVLALCSCSHVRSVPADKSEERVVHNDPIESYQTITFDGWTLRASHRFGQHKALKDEVVKEVRYQLHRCTTVLPAAVITEMKKTEIWLEYRFPGVGQYHPSAGWLKKNGYNPRKAKTIELPFADQFLKHRRAAVSTMMHELFHAWHDRVIGFDDARVIAAYKGIVASGKYESVLHLNHRKVPHYALSNHKEYFAEMSEAYFMVNDYFPFVSAELKRYDPKTYALMKTIWTEAVSKK
jgi:hypothetical protein